MGASQAGGNTAQQLQLAAAGRARRADAIGRQEGPEGETDIDEGIVGQNEFGPGILSGGINQSPNMSPMDLGKNLGGSENFSKLLAELSRRKGGNK